MSLININKDIKNKINSKGGLWDIVFLGSPKEKKDLFLRLKSLKKKKIIKNPKAFLNYRLLGYTHNALIAWRMERIDSAFIKDKLSEIKNVTHCVIRKPQRDFNFNLFTMVHAKNKNELINTITMLKNIFRADDYLVMETQEELIKRPFYG